MKISMIVAMDENGAIGYNNTIPWRLREDMRYFKQFTRNKVVLMGRNTAQSIGKALPNRYNIVLSTNDLYEPPEDMVKVANTTEAIVEARAAIAANPELEDELVVLGGCEVYSVMLPLTETIVATLVKARIKRADTHWPTGAALRLFFGEGSTQNFSFEILHNQEADEHNEYPFSIVRYTRRNAVRI